MHIKDKPNALQPQHHTKTDLKYPSQTTDSMDTSSSALSLSCCTTLLANHSPITLNSKSHLLFRCPTNTHTADLSVGLVHLCGILALLRFYTIISWQHLSPSVHLLNFPFFFSTIILFILNTAAFSSLFSLFFIFFPHSWSSKQLRGVHHFYWTHKLLFPHRLHLKLSHVRHLKKLRASKTKLNLLSPLFVFCICWEHYNPPGSQPIHRKYQFFLSLVSTFYLGYMYFKVGQL